MDSLTTLIHSLAQWVWSGNTNDDKEDAGDVSPELCLASLPWMNHGCWSQLLVKGLGIAIIAGACLNKAPMIYNIWTTQSTEGLSGGALYGELLVVGNSSLYGILMAYPFTAYGEALALFIQAFVLIVLRWILANHPPVSQFEVRTAIVAAIMYTGTILYVLPVEYYSLLMASTWPLQVYAKGAQIYESFRVKHTGAQAIVTILMNVVGSSLRIVTTLKEIGWDLAFLAGSLLSVALNSILLLQYMIYRKNTTEFIRRLEKQKKS
jgi:mannose-P-dolichol utilization defect protein 1